MYVVASQHRARQLQYEQQRLTHRDPLGNHAAQVSAAGLASQSLRTSEAGASSCIGESDSIFDALNAIILGKNFDSQTASDTGVSIRI